MRLLSITLLAFLVISCQTKPAEKRPLKETVVIEVEEVDTVDVEVPIIKIVEEKVEVTKKTISDLPDFAQYKNVKKKKQAFFDYLRPMIVAENNRIMKERSRIQVIFSAYDKEGTIAENDRKWLQIISKGMRMEDFEIEEQNKRNTLLRKIDIVPSSLFLAQAANESAWGTSRFAKEANNLFGQWCYTPGCGIVPSQRKPNETNEVRKFATIDDAVKSYVRNINSYYAYRKLRNIREEIRNKGGVPDGHSLAKGLAKYSSRGEEYVKEIQAIIRVNKLEETL